MIDRISIPKREPVHVENPQKTVFDSLEKADTTKTFFASPSQLYEEPKEEEDTSRFATEKKEVVNQVQRKVSQSVYEGKEEVIREETINESVV